MTLPTFREDSTCRKCGETDIYLRFEANCHHAGDCSVPREMQNGPGSKFDQPCCSLEHIEKSCRRCGFAWAEAVLAP